MRRVVGLVLAVHVLCPLRRDDAHDSVRAVRRVPVRVSDDRRGDETARTDVRRPADDGQPGIVGARPVRRAVSASSEHG